MTNPKHLRTGTGKFGLGSAISIGAVHQQLTMRLP